MGKKCFVLIPMLFLLLFFAPKIHGNNDNRIFTSKYSNVTAEVIDTYPIEMIGGIQERRQTVVLKILEGEFTGYIIESENTLLTNPCPNKLLNQGERVILTIHSENGQIISSHIAEYSRLHIIYTITGLFIILLIIIGGMRGLRSVISLILTGFCIFYILLPLILNGKNPLFITIILLTGVTLVTLPIISGFNTKTWVATLGTITGVFIAGIISFISGELIHLTGFVDEHAQNLRFFLDIPLDLRGILFSSIIIGALGATMDVGMSIASALSEIKKVNQFVTPQELFNAGMNFGRDILGTMTNTLILAYVGSSLPMLLYSMTFQSSYLLRINSEFVSTEIVRAISGSIGLIFTVPITSFLGAILFSKYR